MPFMPRRLYWKKMVLFSILTLTWSIIIFWLSFGKNTGWLDSVRLWFTSFEFNASIYYAVRFIGYLIIGYNAIGMIGPALASLTMIGIGIIWWKYIRKTNWIGHKRCCLLSHSISWWAPLFIPGILACWWHWVYSAYIHTLLFGHILFSLVTAIIRRLFCRKLLPDRTRISIALWMDVVGKHMGKEVPKWSLTRFFFSNAPMASSSRHTLKYKAPGEQRQGLYIFILKRHQ